MIQIVIFTALPQEHTLFRRMTSPWEPTGSVNLRSYRKHLSEREVILIETGMGRRAIQRALDEVLRGSDPDLILSTGFAGSLDQGLGVGKVCLGDHFLTVHGRSPLKRQSAELTCPTGPALERLGSEWGLARVRVATVEEVLAKQPLCEHLGGASTLVDMETYFTAMAAAKRGIPFLSIRSVSDGLSDVIEFDIAALTDQDGRVLVSRVIWSLLKSPRLLGSLIAAWKRSRHAASSLAAVLQAFLSLPSEDLGRILQEQRVSILTSPEG
jgi:nucleoside phosphorylase